MRTLQQVPRSEPATDPGEKPWHLEALPSSKLGEGLCSKYELCSRSPSINLYQAAPKFKERQQILLHQKPGSWNKPKGSRKQCSMHIGPKAMICRPFRAHVYVL